MLVRLANADDAPFLVEMLVEAAYWRPAESLPADAAPRSPETLLDDPTVARYVAGWPRPGDVGVVAEDETGKAGAAWWRHFTTEHHGYGFVDEAIPEISIGVRSDARGGGVGTALLQALVDEGRRRGEPALSLSVEPDNPAVRLYERLGFVVIDADGGALTMLCALAG